jgi:hypothetical protein
MGPDRYFRPHVILSTTPEWQSLEASLTWRRPLEDRKDFMAERPLQCQPSQRDDPTEIPKDHQHRFVNALYLSERRACYCAAQGRRNGPTKVLGSEWAR